MKRNFENKPSDAIINLLPEKINNNLIVFYFTDYDCGSCVEFGFKMLEIINSKVESDSDSVFVITRNLSSSLIRLNYGYSGKIIFDEKNVVGIEYNFTYTPFFVIINKKRIEKVFFIESNTNLLEKYLIQADSILQYVKE